MDKCFLFDKEKFIDNTKFDNLASILPNLIDIFNQPNINYE